MGTRRLHVALILAAALAVRWPVLLAPDTAVLGWRPADLASVAYSYVEHGMDFLRPEVFWGGPGPNYVEMEFPLVPFILAVLYRMFGVHEGLAAIVPVLSGLGAPVGLYFLCRRLIGTEAALIGSVLFAVSPVFANHTQSLFSDGLMTTCSVLAVLGFERWTDTGFRRAFAGAAIATALAGLLKPYSLVIGAPMLYLAVNRFGLVGTLRRRSIWIFGALTLAPTAWWYWHAYRLGVASGNSVGILAGGYSKMWHADLLASSTFWRRLATRLVAFHLTPVGAAGCVIAIFGRARSEGVTTLTIWFAAAMAGAIVAAEGTYQMLYYQLPILPPAFGLAGVGILQAWKWLPSIHAKRPLGARLPLASFVVFLVFVGAMTVFASHWAFNRRQPRGFQEGLRLQGERIASFLRPGEPIVLLTEEYSGGRNGYSYTWRKLPRGQHMTPPDLFYFSRHRGWYLAFPWVTVAEIRALREKGAAYLVISRDLADDVRTFRRERPDLVEAFGRDYAKVVDHPDLLIYDLGTR